MSMTYRYTCCLHDILCSLCTYVHMLASCVIGVDQSPCVVTRPRVTTQGDWSTKPFSQVERMLKMNDALTPP